MIPPGLELEPNSFMSNEEEPTPVIVQTKNPDAAAEVATVELTNLHRGDDDNNNVIDMTSEVAVRADDSSSSFVLRRQQPRDPVLVETVESEDDFARTTHQQQQQREGSTAVNNDNKKKEDLQITVFDIFPQNTQAAIRCTMTLLAACLVPAVCLTLLGAMESHSATGFLVLVVVWVVLLSLFAALVWFVQKVILEHDHHQRNAQVFHPYIHAVADMIVQEYRDLKEDWKYEYLLMLEDGPVDAVSTEETEYVRMDDENATATARIRKQQTGRGRKPKSAIFRNIVKPIMRPLFSRRRKRKLQRQQEAVVAAENYVPVEV